MVLAAVEDLIFLSKIQQTAGLVGVEVKATDPRKLAERVAAGGARAVILDLNLRSESAIEALRALKSNPATRGVPVIGFVSHVQSELIASARSAGCDQVLARSAFSAELPELLRKYARLESPAPEGP